MSSRVWWPRGSRRSASRNCRRLRSGSCRPRLPRSRRSAPIPPGGPRTCRPRFSSVASPLRSATRSPTGNGCAPSRRFTTASERRRRRLRRRRDTLARRDAGPRDARRPRDLRGDPCLRPPRARNPATAVAAGARGGGVGVGIARHLRRSARGRAPRISALALSRNGTSGAPTPRCSRPPSRRSPAQAAQRPTPLSRRGRTTCHRSVQPR